MVYYIIWRLYNMGFIQILKLIISLLPVIIDAIKTIEAAIPQQGAGADKLALLKTILQATYDSSTETAGQFEKIWPAIQSSVSGIVSLFNKAKVWNGGNKGASTQPTQVTNPPVINPDLPTGS